MNDEERQLLLQLARDWQAKAEAIREKHGKLTPNLVKHVAAALDTCAAQVKDIIFNRR